MSLCQEGWSCYQGAVATPIGEEGIKISPNPSTDKVTITFDSPDPRTAIYYRITDMFGNVVLQENVLLASSTYSRELDFSGYAAGVYVLRVIGTCEEIEKKIVIIK